MHTLSKNFFLTVGLLAFFLFLQSCSEQGIQLDKQKVQFTLSSAPGGRAGDIDLPENAHAKISVASSNGVSILSGHEIAVFKRGDAYVTDLVELTPGSYVITDFMVVKDDEDLYVTPKKSAELSTSMTDALPYNFSVTENSAAMLTMQVVNVRNVDLQRFGYSSRTAQATSTTLSLAAYRPNGAITRASAELRQNKKVVKTFYLAAAVNTITVGGDATIPYTLTVYTPNFARTQTLDMNNLEGGTADNPLKIMLEPALVLTVQSGVDAGNEYEEYFEFRMEGSGSVNVNWGDGEQSAATLPFETSHEYFSGDYTAIVTGNINSVTDFSGFSYSTSIMAITGLTNLTALKVYDPSWGAVPIKVDLTECRQLERISVAKYGAPYEPADLRTDFKLPGRHLINTFIFDAPSFDVTREYISAEELESMVNNIYNNTKIRKIYNGKFFVNPVVTPNAATQQKIDILKNQYNWTVGFNDEIYGDYASASGRSRITSDPDTRREQWLRERFSNSEKIIKRSKAVSSLNVMSVK